MRGRDERQKLIEEIEMLIKELNDVDKIMDFLEGKFIPKCQNKYVLYFKKPAGETDLSFAYYYEPYKFLYAFVSQKTPFVIREKRNREIEIARLEPVEKDAYVIIRPETQVTLQIIGWPRGEITFKVCSDAEIYEANFDDRAVRKSFENFPLSMHYKLLQVVKLMTSLGTINAKQVYSKHIALEYLSNHEFVYETYAWYIDSLDSLRLLLLNTSLKGTISSLVAAVTDIPDMILRLFNKLLDSVERVEILKEANEDGTGKDA